MVYIGADHGGFQLKEKMKSWLKEWSVEFVDVGAFALDESDDYPDIAKSVTRHVVENPEKNFGVLLCKSGGGMVIAANRFPQARAVYIFDEVSAAHAKTDNNANIAAFAASWIDESVAKQSLFVFLQTQFSNEERHIRRIGKIEAV